MTPPNALLAYYPGLQVLLSHTTRFQDDNLGVYLRLVRLADLWLPVTENGGDPVYVMILGGMEPLMRGDIAAGLDMDPRLFARRLTALQEAGEVHVLVFGRKVSLLMVPFGPPGFSFQKWEPSSYQFVRQALIQVREGKITPTHTPDEARFVTENGLKSSFQTKNGVLRNNDIVYLSFLENPMYNVFACAHVRVQRLSKDSKDRYITPPQNTDFGLKPDFQTKNGIETPDDPPDSPATKTHNPLPDTDLEAKSPKTVRNVDNPDHAPTTSPAHLVAAETYFRRRQTAFSHDALFRTAEQISLALANQDDSAGKLELFCQLCRTLDPVPQIPDILHMVLQPNETKFTDSEPGLSDRQLFSLAFPAYAAEGDLRCMVDGLRWPADTQIGFDEAETVHWLVPVSPGSEPAIEPMHAAERHQWRLAAIEQLN